MASPRCPSRDSTSDHSPSEDSVYSGRNMHMPPNAVSPVGIALPATIPPPSVPAAMAAYLGAAAAAAQQNRMLSSLAGLAGKVSVSPLPLTSPLGGDSSSILDFSTKCKSSDSIDGESDNDAVNLCKTDTSGALDLSCGSRKRSTDEPVTPVHSRKISRNDYKPNVSPWTSPVAPYLAAAVAAANMSPKNPPISEWNNGKNKIAASSSTNDATKALEKMSELSRLGGEDMYKSGGNSVSSSGGRHSAWQSHWLNKGADSTKDVLKCVWCKQSFPTLAAMSTHMRETKHCNVNAPPSSNNLAPPQTNSSSGSNASHSHSSHLSSAAANNREHRDNTTHEPRAKPTQSELNMLIKETMPIPRKLVRGQDVWLGKGAEQTRQILKCMWCGQSFRSLAEMTNHMQQTQHYTNIISQEQIISWKSSDGSGGGGGGGAGGPGGNSGNGQGGGGSSSTVSAVLTCKVCTKSFNSLKELSDHMVKHDHYKEHIMRSISESTGRRRQTREKRKKSLPVRKLLELERAQHDFKNGDTPPLKSHQNESPSMVGSRITCEKCGDKIDTIVFVEHIRQCVGGGGMNATQKNLLKSALTSNAIISPDSMMGPLTPNSRDGRKSIGGDDMSSPMARHISPAHPTDLSSSNSKESNITGGGNDKSSSPSVLNAIEQLIEKSFDTKSRHPGFAGPNQSTAPLGSSILKRLGIDESVDYTKPLIDPQTMNFLRSYQQHQAARSFERRERSGSESSSVSDRGSSRMDSLTPERKLDHNVSQSTTPRTTPDKLDGGSLGIKSEHMMDDSILRIKNEPMEDSDMNCDESAIRPTATNISIKRENEDERPESRHETMSNHHGDDHRRTSRASTPARSPRRTPIHPSPIPSPASERSVTPRSTPGIISDTKKSGMSGGGSLGALSSMFDSLTGSNAPGSSVDGHGSGSQKKQNAHPLAALQKLCDKTETNQQSSRTNSLTANPATSSASSSSSTPSSQQAGGGGGTSASGAMVAFSWACNDAVVTADSIMKCAYCDTPFISKGAYRHHLSKMHFVKDDVIPDPVKIKSEKQIPPPSPNSPKNNNDRHSDRHHSRHNDHRNDRHHRTTDNGQNAKSPPPPHSTASTSGGNNMASTSTANLSGNNGGGSSGSNSAAAAAAAAAFEESPHSKFLKYTELAKQLSSKYV